MGLGSHLDGEVLAELRRLTVEEVAKPVTKPRAAEPQKPANKKTRHKVATPKKPVKKKQRVVASTYRPVKKNRPVLQTDDDRRRNGLTPPRTSTRTTTVAKRVLYPEPVVAPKRGEKAPEKFEVPVNKSFQPKPNAKVALTTAQSRLAVEKKRILVLCRDLNIEIFDDGNTPSITGASFEMLRHHVALLNTGIGDQPESQTFEERLRGKYSAGAWNGDGSPLARYDAKKEAVKKESAPKTGSVPFIKVVSGGLPTLGKGHH